MNSAAQIVENHYGFILQQCRAIKKNHDETNDLAHDIVEKILGMDSLTIKKLKQNPKGFIRTMLVNKNLDQKRKQKVQEKFAIQTLYSRKPHEDIGDSFFDELSNDPHEMARKIAKIKQLTDEERMWLAVLITYPNTTEASKKLGMKWITVHKYKKKIFEKLK